MEFIGFPKMARLNREIIITEKIDGTNAAVVVTDEGLVYAQSRTRIIKPGDDNFGFAAWVAANEGPLRDVLGPGRHFGEWWGAGIQRKYGRPHKTFSLFNVSRWTMAETDLVENLSIVPRLYTGAFDQVRIQQTLDLLREHGSMAAPGFMQPEGICIYHTAANQTFKVTLENDESPKSLVK